MVSPAPLGSLALVAPLLLLLACDGEGSGEPAPTAADCPLNPEDPSLYVIVGFWDTADCSGEPVSTNAFPVDDADGCYCWPGHSGENSADTFVCNPDGVSFTYTQYGSLTCGAGDDSPTEKTSFTTSCEQDIPPTLYSMVLDLGPCGAR